MSFSKGDLSKYIYHRKKREHNSLSPTHTQTLLVSFSLPLHLWDFDVVRAWNHAPCGDSKKNKTTTYHRRRTPFSIDYFLFLLWCSSNDSSEFMHPSGMRKDSFSPLMMMNRVVADRSSSSSCSIWNIWITKQLKKKEVDDIIADALCGLMVG